MHSKLCTESNHDGLHRVRVAELEGIVRHRRDVAVAPVHRAPARAGPLASSSSTAVNFAACVQAFRRAPRPRRWACAKGGACSRHPMCGRREKRVSTALCSGRTGPSTIVLQQLGGGTGIIEAISTLGASNEFARAADGDGGGSPINDRSTRGRAPPLAHDDERQHRLLPPELGAQSRRLGRPAVAALRATIAAAAAGSATARRGVGDGGGAGAGLGEPAVEEAAELQAREEAAARAQRRRPLPQPTAPRYRP
eukprot:COSAG04_NODE_148_length_22826_cov_11.360026_5_plen_253_part_00